MSRNEPDVQVDLGVEVHEQDRWEEAEDDGLAPVVVDGIFGVDPQLSHVQLDLGHVHAIDLRNTMNEINQLF